MTHELHSACIAVGNLAGENEERGRIIADLELKLTLARQQLATALEDSKLLDWAQENLMEEGRTMTMPRYGYRIAQWNGAPGPNIRASIRAAMQAKPTPL